MTLEEIVPSCTQKTEQDVSDDEVERLKHELLTERKRISAMAAELQSLKTEVEENKSKTETFAFLTSNLEDRRYMQSRTRLELEDAENAIAELKQELDYKTSVNHSLALQLEKTIESNSELLLEIKDLDDLLQSREMELEKFRGKEAARLEEEKALWIKKIEDSERELKEEKVLWRRRLDEAEQVMREEKALWMGKLAESEQMIKDLELSIKGTASRSLKNCTEGLDADFGKLKADFKKVEMELAEIREENVNLLSQLMNLRLQAEEKDGLIHQLESKLATWQDHVDQLTTAENVSEKKLMRELESAVSDLREKLHISEELSQSQLDSNKAFLEELNSMVEALQTKNKQLEIILKSSEESNASLTQELATLRQDMLEHEKEKSMLGLLRGQIKTLREKISVVTQNYDLATKQIENLEAVNNSLREKNDESSSMLKQELLERDAECSELKRSLAEVEARLKQKQEDADALVNAKEAAEVSLSLLQKTNAELLERMNSLLLEKDEADAFLLTLSKVHSDLQGNLRQSEDLASQRFQQLQVANGKVSNLSIDLETAQAQLQEAWDKLERAESLKSDLARQLEETRAHVADLELQISHLNEDADILRKSLKTSEDRVCLLQLENTETAAKLSDAVSEKEEINHRLETAIKRERELEVKVATMESELLDIKRETAVCEGVMNQLENRLQILTSERTDQHEAILAEVQELKASLRETQLGKEEAEASKNKLQDDNARLSVEVGVWKDKNKADDDEIQMLRERLKGGSGGVTRPRHHSASSLEEKSSAVNGVAKKNVLELDQKSELIRLRKHATDSKRKPPVGQEEEKEEIKKKAPSIQKDAQRKCDVQDAPEKKLTKEKEKEDSVFQRLAKPSTRINHKVTSNAPSSTISQSAKTVVSASEKVKALEV
jgi:chromosome segregation ATPase